MACAMLRTNQPNGRCRPAKAGTDPHDDCSVEAAFSCKTTGACNGSFALSACLAEGVAAGAAAARLAGIVVGSVTRAPFVVDVVEEPIVPLWLVPSAQPRGCTRPR